MTQEKHGEYEKHLYDYMYNNEYCDTTGYWREIVGYIVATSQTDDKLLDIGCGHGDPTRVICSHGRNCTGVDISLAGLNSKRKTGHEYDEFIPACSFTEAPLWDMPFDDNAFDYTFSFDVMEHLITETVMASIKEIYRITRVKTFHCIATIPSTANLGIHKTVMPIEWWRKRFYGLNTKGIDVHVCGHIEFLNLHGELCGRDPAGRGILPVIRSRQT